MVNFLKSRDMELKYTRYIQDLKSRQKAYRQSCTPWKVFFETGVGATVRTTILKSSVQCIVYGYGKKLGKRFRCSYIKDGEELVVSLESIEDR